MSGGARCCFGLLTLVAQVHPRHPHHCHHRHHYRHCHDCQKKFAEIDVFWANFIGIFLNGMFLGLWLLKPLLTGSAARSCRPHPVLGDTVPMAGIQMMIMMIHDR